jgi:hypothetical protein
MAASWYYLEQRPEGQYHARLKRYFDKAEPVFYKARRRSMKGLEAYLRALPNGPHAGDVLGELMAMRDSSRRDQLMTRQARQAGLRLDVERHKREQAATLLGWWIGSLLDRRVWQRPLSDAPSEFVVRYRLALPRPECEPHDDDPDHQRCFKSVAQSFRIAGRGKLESRTLAFDLELELDERWHLMAATIAGPALFLTSVEAQRERIVDEGDAGAQKQAVDGFIAKLGAELAARDIACDGGSTEGGGTVLDCEGIRLTIEPGQGGGDDVLFVQPMFSESGSAADAGTDEGSDGGADPGSDSGADVGSESAGGDGDEPYD